MLSHTFPLCANHTFILFLSCQAKKHHQVLLWNERMKGSPGTAGFASRFLPAQQSPFLNASKGAISNYCYVLLIVRLRKSGNMLQSVQRMNTAN